MTPYDSPEWAALIAGIRADPDDDVRRGVAADWLDDHGEGGRAAIIRRQCRHPKYWHFTPALNGLRLIGHRGFVFEVRGPLAAFWSEEPCERCMTERSIGAGLTFRPTSPETGCPTCRGTARVSGPSPAWVALCRREPIRAEGVTVTDREPHEDHGEDGPSGTWTWWRMNPEYTEDASDLSDELFDLLAGGTLGTDAVTSHVAEYKEYPTADAARLALGAALLAAALSTPAEVRT